MQAKRHTLISMASHAYNAQTAISISRQYFLAPLSFHMIAPKASFQVKVDDFDVFLQSPAIYTVNGPKNSHANNVHLIMVWVKWSLFMPKTTNGKSAKSPVVIMTCPTTDNKTNKAEKTVNGTQLRFSLR
ncbi:hypothetical protein [Prevotella sp. P2-180]|uniref:hypothetical protein n=1 Tax=Prevotella sp. P2-180 TaxID=2024224 RepID=UPI000B96758C|nr:hypothetical protein [Prevotella sp. P2-180]